MNISQALKEKNKKAALLAKLIERFKSSNMEEKGIAKDYSSKETLKDINIELSALVSLKTAIHKASAPVREKIFKLSELKGLSKNMQFLNTTPAINKSRQDGHVISELTPEINTKEYEGILKGISDEIDKIQEELDAFNHTTSI